MAAGQDSLGGPQGINNNNKIRWRVSKIKKSMGYSPLINLLLLERQNK